MKIFPFGLLVDGSNDTGVEKLNPLTVRILDINKMQVTTQLLDMCTTSGRHCGTADSIFSKIDSVLTKHDIPWQNCVGFGVDNTSVNVGLRHSIMTHVKQKNTSCYFMGCPCHLIHNVACRASEAFQESSGFDIEDFCVDIFYWFDKSTKRKGILREFCDFCDNEYHEVVRYVSVRWLSLEKAIYRILQLYVSLQSYFKSESESQARFARLLSAFNNPMTEIYLLFYEAVLPTFTNLNRLLQREDPNIFLVGDAIQSFLKKILAKFVTLQAIKAHTDIMAVDFQCPSNQLDDDKITIGFTTKQCLLKLFDEGSISDSDKKKFFTAVRAFYIEATLEGLRKLPFHDPTIHNAKFLNFEKREECTFSDVEYFCSRYSELLNFTSAQMDKLQEEFFHYQLLEKSTIPDMIWTQALVREEGEGSNKVEYFRMDVVWAYLMGLKNVDGSLTFELLSKVARLVLVIPHSNAGGERVFSLIKHNKTPGRSSLNINGTLSSMIQVKLANPATCVKWEPPKELLTAAKKATKQYNDMHKTR